MIKTALFAVAAALATVATAAPVLAKDMLAQNMTSKQMVVRYGDLDLASAKGQRAFSQRIVRAAKNVCDYGSNGRTPSPSEIACFKQTRANATTQMASRVEDARLGG